YLATGLLHQDETAGQRSHRWLNWLATAASVYCIVSAATLPFASKAWIGEIPVFGLFQLPKAFIKPVIHASLFANLGCDGAQDLGLQLPKASDTKVSTELDRAALADYLIEKTVEREAFSPPKHKRLGFEPIVEMRKYRDAVVNANTEADLYIALQKMSNARHDRHLRVRQLDGGPSVVGVYAEVLQRIGMTINDGVVPVKLAADFSKRSQPKLFIKEVGVVEGANADSIAVGDWVTEVNGRTGRELEEELQSWFAYSTTENFWMNMPARLTSFSTRLPPDFYAKTLSLKLENEDGEAYAVELPYLSPQTIKWSQENRKAKYPGFTQVKLRKAGCDSFDVYRPNSETDVKALVLDWHGFNSDLERATNSLISFADKERLLHYDLIIDLTQSRGGSRGAYAIRRLTSKPFKTTFGNLRLSDAANEFVKRKSAQAQSRGSSKSMLMDWIDEEVRPAIAAGHEYTENVPFKCAHAPHDSDGIIKPAPKHFRGRMICWFGPSGGSHLDQFSAIVNDNDLAWTIGMQTGGYSNTWEHVEAVNFPISGKPAIQFMWSIGHTIRPNGQILEGNPAKVDKYIPITRENFASYRKLLLKTSLRSLRE
ncbi:hypothetical protein N9L06_06640, partial [Mariniblastus sp.]|nr:hypothetical protein [Mariniblastus sp.]